MKQEQKSRIVKAAFDEWTRTRYTRTSLSLVAARLSLTKQAIYRYFPNKAALVACMVDELLSDLSHVTDAIERLEVTDAPAGAARDDMGHRISFLAPPEGSVPGATPLERRAALAAMGSRGMTSRPGRQSRRP